MPNYNKVLLMGNITRDIEIRYTPSGMAVAQLGIAVNRKFKDSKTNELREEVTFVDVDFFGKRAETAHQYLAKGQPVFIEGRL
jgi:single-strand DNA-binding protein